MEEPKSSSLKEENASPGKEQIVSVTEGQVAEGKVLNLYDRKPESLRNLSDEEFTILSKKLVQKMDFFILPTIRILYILNYIPSNLIITKISRPGMYICFAVSIWGSISAATAAVTTYRQLLAVRAILGIAEAIFFPGAIYYLSAWYTKKELGKRIASLYIAQQVGNAFGGLFAAAVLQLDGTHGIAGWQWLFIIEGSVTVAIGVICAFIMPEFPHNSRILSQPERDLAVWRIESEAGAAEGTEDESLLQGFIKALSDPKLLLLIFCNMLSQAQGSIANFFPTLVDSLNFSHTIGLLLTAPPYILAGFVYY